MLPLLFIKLPDDATDEWCKQILKVNNKEEGLWLSNNIMWTTENTKQTI